MIKTLILVLTMACAATASAQQPVTYQPSRDSTWLQSLNIFKMYFVRAGDTLGEWVHAFSVERHAWLHGTGRSYELRRLRLDVARKVDTDTLTLAPSGRVLTINGNPPATTPRGQYDALPRLPDPARQLRVGDTWVDTIRIEGTTPTGDIVHAGTRRYRVHRRLDTLGTRGALEVTSEGELRYRDGYWADSAAGVKMWIDVSGPMTSRFVFDAERGRLLGDQWSMHLQGTGGIPNQAGGQDTVPAGLFSSNIERFVSSERAAALWRSLGDGDTLVSRTSQGGTILVHVGSRLGDTLLAALGRNDGMVGTVRTVVDARGIPLTYTAHWTDSTGDRRHQVETRRDAVSISGVKRAAPATPWSIADYAMDHLLLPMLRALPTDDEARPITIYRPYPDKWETGTARVRAIPGGFAAVILMSDKAQPDVLIVTSEWRLVAVVNQATGTERVPHQGGELWRIMERLLAALQRRA